MTLNFLTTHNSRYDIETYKRYESSTNMEFLTQTNLSKKYYVPWNWFMSLPFVKSFENEGEGDLVNYVGEKVLSPIFLK